ncbi:MAG: hypothetical protein R2788_08490 [Saprospiraceae bacterium]
MNSLELKGGIFEMIAQVDNKEVLQRLYKVVAEILHETWAEEQNLTPEQEEKLSKDIEDSFNPDNLVSHEESMKTMARWLNK